MLCQSRWLRIPRLCAREIVNPGEKKLLIFLGGSSAKIRFILTCCERSSVYDIRKIGLD